MSDRFSKKMQDELARIRSFHTSCKRSCVVYIQRLLDVDSYIKWYLNDCIDFNYEVSKTLVHEEINFFYSIIDPERKLEFDNRVITLAPDLFASFAENNTIEIDGSRLYDLDCDLHFMPEILGLASDTEAMTNLYRAMCNVTWVKNGITWGCSWRFAGAVVANFRNTHAHGHSQVEEYLDYYCSGGEGTVDPDIAEILNQYNWVASID